VADLLALAVRYLHILSAILWIGALGFSVMVLRRVMPRLEMPARKDVLRQLIPVVIRFIPATATLTIVFGAILYLLLGNFDPNVLVGSTWGLVLLAALILALALFAFGLLVVIRASRRILDHLNEPACSHGPEMGRLTKRFNNGQVVALVWGALILSLMILATEAL
jgi:putative copper export protein